MIVDVGCAEHGTAAAELPGHCCLAQHGFSASLPDHDSGKDIRFQHPVSLYMSMNDRQYKMVPAHIQVARTGTSGTAISSIQAMPHGVSKVSSMAQ